MIPYLPKTTSINTKFIQGLACLFSAVCMSEAQLPASPVQQAVGDYAITQVGPHSRVWQNAAGQSVTEIATGMNRWNGTQWVPSNPQFVVSPDGTAFVADQIQDPTQLAANLNTVGAVSVTTPEGVHLSSTPIAIGLYDAASGLSAIVATLTNTTGILTDPQHVVYNQAFVGGGFAASVVYSLPDTGSFHQDVIFTGYNPSFNPTNWGFAEDSTNTLQLQIITEFYAPPQPLMVTNMAWSEQDPSLRANMASPDLYDFTLDFGHYVFGPGSAYTTASNAGPNVGVRVCKDFVTSSNRTFLIESIPLIWLTNQLRSLPPVGTNTGSLWHPRTKRMRLAVADLPSLRETKKIMAEKSLAVKRIARRVGVPKGVDVDYVATVSSTVEPTLFAADTTYFVNGTVTCSGPTTMESAIFKYPTNYIGMVEVDNSLSLVTTNYRPVVFTAADDNSIGTQLSTGIWSNYSGQISSNYYGLLGLNVNNTRAVSLNNMRFDYLTIGMALGVNATNQAFTISSLQMLNCAYGVYISNSLASTLNVNNCLFENEACPFYQYGVASPVFVGTMCDCTLDNCGILVANSTAYTTFYLTNCILSSIDFVTIEGGPAVEGGYNAFYNCGPFVVFGTPYTNLSSSPYQTVGAGNYYLPAGSGLLTYGTTGTPASLLSQLQAKTVEGPLSLPGVFLTNLYTSDTVLTEQAPLDTNGTALGFHYDKIDYLAACSVSNATLTLTNGVVLAYGGTNPGVSLLSGSSLYSQGTPNQRNYLVYYGLVQEQPTNLAGPLSNSIPIWVGVTNDAVPGPSNYMRFTTISAPQGETNLLNTSDSNQVISSWTLRDCEVYGAGASWIMNESNNTPTIGLTNNVFHYVPFAISNNATIYLYNNLFYGTTNSPGNVTNTAISIRHRGGGTTNFIIKNNVFDGVTNSLDGTVGYNGYINGATNTGIQGTDIRTNLAWLAGPLGAYYQTNTSPFLTNGSTSATNLGLYHYTVQTNEAIEGTNLVSRGYHYVALGTNGLPLVSNTNGVPDYLADANGDGSVDDGELAWEDAPEIITQPANVASFLNSNVSFTVVAQGTLPLDYQWYSNGIAITGATGSTYSIASFQSNEVAKYYVTLSNVVVTNVAGVVTSSVATLNFASRTNWVASYASDWFGAPAIGPNGTTVFVPYINNNTGGTGVMAFTNASTNGKAAWTNNVNIYDAEALVSPVIGSNGVLYIGGPGGLYAVNTNNGHTNWVSDPSLGLNVSTTVAVSQSGTIYAGTGAGLFAFADNGSTNTLLWSNQVAASSQSEPAIGPNCAVAYFNGLDGLWTLASGGNPAWLFPPNYLEYSAPALGADGSICVATESGYLLMLNPNGTLKWLFNTGSSFPMFSGSPVIGTNDTVYCSVYNGTGILFAITNGTVMWALTNSAAYSTGPAVAGDGTVYVGDSVGYLYAITNGGGHAGVDWKYMTASDGIYYPPIIGPDGTIYVVNDGNLYSLYGPAPAATNASWPMFGQNPALTGSVPETNCASGDGDPPVLYGGILTVTNNVPTNFLFYMQGPPNSAWNIYASSDSMGWSNVASVTLSASGTNYFKDTNTGAYPFRLYLLDNGSTSSEWIGYTSMIVATNTNLIANPFFQCDQNWGNENVMNTLAGLFTGEHYPKPATSAIVQEWTGVGFNNYTNQSSGSWHPNGDATILPGAGVNMINPSSTTNYTNWYVGVTPLGPLPQTIVAGTNYLSAMLPVAGPVTSVLNYSPAEGDQVWIWNSAGSPQAFLKYTNTLGVWSPNEPYVSIGQGFVLVTTNAQTLSQSSDNWEASLEDSPFTTYDQNPFTIYDQGTTIDGWSPTNVRLGYWRFNTSALTNEAGLPWTTSNSIATHASWSGTALVMTNTDPELEYPVSTNGLNYFDCTNGTIRFWFKPLWTSTSSSNSSATFLSMGYGGASNEQWQLSADQLVITNVVTNSMTMVVTTNITTNMILDFLTSANPFYYYHFGQGSIAPVLSLESNHWYQMCLTYSPSNVAFYTNGVLFATGNSYPETTSNNAPLFEYGGEGVEFYPIIAAQDGFSFGSGPRTGLFPAMGWLDELETFNYAMTAQQVAVGFPYFGGNSTNMTDTYYLGRSDMLQTYVDGFPTPSPTNNVPHCRLGYWRFDSPLLYAEQGQMPLSLNEVDVTPSWSGTALNIGSASDSQITYLDVGSNGWANINCRQGSLRFWFKPNGNPSSYPAPFVYMGSPSGNDLWALELTGGNTISFDTQTNGEGLETILSANVGSLSLSNWTQIVLNYGPTSCALYTNGVLAATNNAGNPNWPRLSNRQLGMVIGNSTAYNASINGQFEEMETFNYQLSAANIASNFQMVASVDSDLNGIPDLLEDIHLTTNRPFLGAPVVITGTIEAEQFDMGGPGIGYYHSGMSNPPSSYRPTGMFITNCNDLGLGYCLDQTQSNDWTKYTINVLVQQIYTVETRVAGLGTNGAFEITFTNGVNHTNTGPLVITNTNWTNLSTQVYLNAGTNVMTLTMLTNANTNSAFGTNVGRFNYISIYPWWPVGVTNISGTNTISLTTNTSPANLTLISGTNNSWTAATNNAIQIQNAINSLNSVAGGKVVLPAGEFLVTQLSPNETNDAYTNAAVNILGNNVEIAGAGETNTTLIAYNRATTVLCVGKTSANIPIQCVNITLRDMTIESQPHRAVYETNNTQYNVDQFVPTGGQGDAGALTIFYGAFNAFSKNILITNCQFLSADRSIVLQSYDSNVMVRGCNFVPTGTMDTFGDTNVYYEQSNFTFEVSIYARSLCYNLSVLENTYNGNILITNTTHDTGVRQAADGLVFFQYEGNAFIARNFITNNFLEEIQLSGGPNVVVGNTFNTLISYPSACALDFSATDAGVTKTSLDWSTCFVGNSIVGEREGSRGPANQPYTLNFSGNSLTLSPGVDENVSEAPDYPGEVVSADLGLAINLCGNTLSNGGFGFLCAGSCSNVLILNNNFGGATYRGIGYEYIGEYVNTAQVFGNILNQGVGFHIQLSYTNSFGWFLGNNAYFNTNMNVVPAFLDPASSSVHIYP